MTRLRDQLERTKAAYRSAGYPGDLSADVGVRERRETRWWAASAAAAAIAAGFVAAVLFVAPVRDAAGQIAGRAIPSQVPLLDSLGPTLPAVGDRPEPIFIRLVSAPGPTVRQAVDESQQTVTEIGQSVESLRRRVGHWMSHAWS